MKKIFFAFLLFTLCSINPIFASEISVYLNDQRLYFDVAPQNIDNRVMVPFRAIGESLGAECHWIEKDNMVIMEKEDGMIGLIIGHNKLYFSDGDAVTGSIDLDVAPQIVNSRTLVPIRAVSESFECAVEWDDTTKSVLIKTDGSTFVPEITVPTVEAESEINIPAVITDIEVYKTALIKNFREFNSEFKLTTDGLKSGDITLDLLELNDTIYQYHYEYIQLGTKIDITYRIEYKMTDKVLSAYRTKSTSKLDQKELELYNKAVSIVQNNISANMSDYQKELKLYDYIILNTVYDYDNYLTDTIPEDSHRPYGALIKGVAVCDGYSEAFRLLTEMAGLECETIYGFSDEPHAWNRIKIDGDYYLVDVTYGDPILEGSTQDLSWYVEYVYFNLTDEQMSIDHKPDKPDNIKCVATEYNYYVYNNLTFSSQEEFETKFAEGLEKGYKSITLKAVDIDLYDVDFITVVTTANFFLDVEIFDAYVFREYNVVTFLVSY